MNSNDLRTLIEVWKYIPGDNAGGTPIESFALYRKKFAKKIVRSGATSYTGLGNLPFTITEVTVRYDKEIDYKCQFKIDGVFYQIDHIEVVDRTAWMKCICTVYNELS